MFSIDLQWLSFPVNLNTVEAWIKTNQGTNYVGNSADRDLTLWFSAAPTSDQTSAIQSYWAGLTTASPEATGYQTQSQMAAAAATKQATDLAAAVAALTALGLTADQIAALRS